MDITTTPVPSTRIPKRRLGVLALLGVLFAALLGAALFATVGSRSQAGPAPAFGKAANGAVIYAKGGDIVSADPATGRTTTLVGGPESDSAPVWSRDGTRFAFTRDPGLLFVASADGSGLVQITPEPMPELTGVSFSPDGRSIVALRPNGDGAAIVVASSDGTQTARTFTVGATLGDGPPQYRPNGTEILFIGKAPGAAVRSVLALDPATGSVRTLVAPTPNFDIWGAVWSPDGTKVAYGTHDATADADAITTRTHVVNADGTSDFAVDTHPDSIADGPSAWSNDGTQLVIVRHRMRDGVVRASSVVVPVDRSSVGVEIACVPDAPQDDCTAAWTWSPDDSMLIASVRGVPYVADPMTGEVRAAPWVGSGEFDMQRRAN